MHVNQELLEIGQQLVRLCQESRSYVSLETLYHPDCVSVEAYTHPLHDSRVWRGMDMILKKHEWFHSTFEEKNLQVEGPFPHGEDRFGVIFRSQLIHKASGEESNLFEIAVYTVADRKIIREEFFYSP